MLIKYILRNWADDLLRMLELNQFSLVFVNASFSPKTLRRTYELFLFVSEWVSTEELAFYARCAKLPSNLCQKETLSSKK